VLRFSGIAFPRSRLLGALTDDRIGCPTIIPGFHVASRSFRCALFPKEGGARYLRPTLTGSLRPLSFSSVSFLRPTPEGSLLRAFPARLPLPRLRNPLCPHRISAIRPHGRVIRAKPQTRRYYRLGSLPRCPAFVPFGRPSRVRCSRLSFAGRVSFANGVPVIRYCICPGVFFRLTPKGCIRVSPIFRIHYYCIPPCIS
jgi:hypothetical protein